MNKTKNHLIKFIKWFFRIHYTKQKNSYIMYAIMGEMAIDKIPYIRAYQKARVGKRRQGWKIITILGCVKFHLKRGYIHHVCALAF